MWQRFFLSFSFFIISCVAYSSNVSISPIHVHFIPHDAIESLQITNIATTPVNFQASVVAWNQKDGKDVYAATDDFILSPPMFTIPPGQTQVMRIGIASASNTPPTIQKTYRLFLTEILPYVKNSPKQRIRLRLSLPVFIDALNPTKRISVVKEKGKVHLSNTGNMTITIGSVDINNKNKNIFIQLVPGSTKTLALPITPTDKLVFYNKEKPINESN